MNKLPYHHYIFFKINSNFYQIAKPRQQKTIKKLQEVISFSSSLTIVPYATLGFKVPTTFALWIRSPDPIQAQNLIRNLLHTSLGQFLTITHTFFGIERPSQYSNRVGKPEQVMQNFDTRLPYLIIYPFTKTSEWHLLPFEKRRELMGQHIKVGLGYKNIRQCLLYSYGVDDNEFIVSYETGSLEDFQDLIIELRNTEVRKYTQNDIPIFTCIYKTPEELIAWI
jgi:chlorite dismutase